MDRSTPSPQPPVLPSAVTVRNYRAFARPLQLELRPITLLYGVNNAGKSALLRVLPLLSESVRPDASGPLHLESEAVRGSTFHDLRWKGLEEEDDRDVGVTLHWDGDPGVARIDYRFTWFDEWRRLIIRRFTVRDDSDDPLFDAAWEPRREEKTASALTYQIAERDSGPAVPIRLPFEGLLPGWFGAPGPAGMPSGSAPSGATADHPLLSNVSERLRALRNRVQWLEAARRSPQRIIPYPNAPRWRMKPGGEDAAGVLATHPEILREVSAWYEHQLKRQLHLQEVPPGSFRLMLRNQQKAELNVDLADTGEGMIQALPVLAALALSRRHRRGGPGILAIEEPESHLHPTLARALAERFCEVAAEDSPPRIVLETHSEELLLGVQLQIVQGRLSPERVLVYWVRQLDSGQSVAERITFDRDARPVGNWPPGVFSEDTEMARQIIIERRKRP